MASCVLASSGDVTPGKQLLLPGTALARLLDSEQPQPQPRSAATQWRAARTLRDLGVPVIKVAGTWRVPLAGLEAWLANPACGAAAAAAQQARRRGPGRPSRAENALRATARALEQGVRHG